ncbi:hypothetical protein V7x_27120 [Crateriforma conspicua]|uniref:Uncharacterized protein n=1 Tax=Crateriforma conspicua TaxID=2527996 RepID=A0A5C6FW38_9PLAN|nr:hypothetical protein V7x_27120 [Crateriforma conspicua]
MKKKEYVPFDKVLRTGRFPNFRGHPAQFKGSGVFSTFPTAFDPKGIVRFLFEIGAICSDCRTGHLQYFTVVWSFGRRHLEQCGVSGGPSATGQLG